jgi:hypothetical protein
MMVNNSTFIIILKEQASVIWTAETEWAHKEDHDIRRWKFRSMYI